jgi:hypothetical protein
MAATLQYLAYIFPTALAFFALWAGWTTGSTDGSTQGGFFRRPKVRRSALGLAVVLLTFGTICVQKRMEESAEAAITELRVQLSSAERTIEDLRSDTVCNFTRDVQLRGWKQQADSRLRAVYLQTTSGRTKLEMALTLVDFARSSQRALGTNEVPACLRRFDDLFKECLQSSTALIDGAFSSYEGVLGSLGLQAPFKDDVAAIRVRCAGFGAAFTETESTVARYGVSAEAARMALQTYEMMSQMLYEAAQLYVEAEYIRRLNEWLPEDLRVGVPGGG